MEEWKSGGVEEWKSGSAEGWENGANSTSAHLMVGGDANIDLLPTLSGDPFVDRPGRSDHHEDRRCLLYDVVDALNLVLHIPDPADTTPERLTEPCFGSPSRIPLGD